MPSAPSAQFSNLIQDQHPPEEPPPTRLVQEEWEPEVIDPPSPTTSAVIKTIVADNREPPEPSLGPRHAQSSGSTVPPVPTYDSNFEMPPRRCRGRRCQWEELHGPMHQCVNECRRAAHHEGLHDCCLHPPPPSLNSGHECGMRCSYVDPWSPEEDQRCKRACKLVNGHRD